MNYQGFEINGSNFRQYGYKAMRLDGSYIEKLIERKIYQGNELLDYSKGGGKNDDIIYIIDENGDECGVFIHRFDIISLLPNGIKIVEL